MPASARAGRRRAPSKPTESAGVNKRRMPWGKDELLALLDILQVSRNDVNPSDDVWPKLLKRHRARFHSSRTHTAVRAAYFRMRKRGLFSRQAILDLPDSKFPAQVVQPSSAAQAGKQAAADHDLASCSSDSSDGDDPADSASVASTVRTRSGVVLSAPGAGVKRKRTGQPVASSQHAGPHAALPSPGRGKLGMPVPMASPERLADLAKLLSTAGRVQPPRVAPDSLSLIDTLSPAGIVAHVASVRAESLSRRYRPLLTKVMESQRNNGMFNVPVDPVALGIPDYPNVVKTPMDLGTVRTKLESGQYSAPSSFIQDVRLVFSNAMSFNPATHPVHLAAKALLGEFNAAVERIDNKASADAKRRKAHYCEFCHGEVCAICGEKCLRFDPPLISCDCCGDRIKRGDTYYRNTRSQRWCVRCVASGGISNAGPGSVLPPTAAVYAGLNSKMLRAMCDDIYFQVMGVRPPTRLGTYAHGTLEWPDGTPVPPRALGTSARAARSSSAPSAGMAGNAAQPGSGRSEDGHVTEDVDTSATASAHSTPAQRGSQAQQAAQRGTAGATDAKRSGPRTRGTVSAVEKTAAPSRRARRGGTAAATAAAAAAAARKRLGSTPTPAPSAVPPGGEAVEAAEAGRSEHLPVQQQLTRSQLVAWGAPDGTRLHITRPLVTQEADLLTLKLIWSNALSKGFRTDLWGARLSMVCFATRKTFVQLLAAEIRAKLEKRKNNEIVVEGWVACDTCGAWVHQVCAMFNERKHRDQCAAAAGVVPPAPGSKADVVVPLNGDDADSIPGWDGQSEYSCPACRYVARAGTGGDSAAASPAALGASRATPITRSTARSARRATGRDSVAASSSSSSSETSMSGSSDGGESDSAGSTTSASSGSVHGRASTSADEFDSDGTEPRQARGSTAAATRTSRGVRQTTPSRSAAVIASAAGAPQVPQALRVFPLDQQLLTPSRTGMPTSSALSRAHVLGVSPSDMSHGVSSAADGSSVHVAACDLPCTQLSAALQKRVRARTAACTDDAVVASSICVREVSSLRLEVRVPDEVRQLYRHPQPPPDLVRRVVYSAASNESGTRTEAAEQQALELMASTPVSPHRSLKRELHVLLQNSIALSRAARARARDAVEYVEEQSETAEPSAVPGDAGPAAHSLVGVPPAGDTSSPAALHYSARYPYRQRVVLLFQRIDGVDVAVFALYVQEFGPDAPPPNTNSVYIAYLDSVRYLRPCEARTPVYHELLTAYLADAAARGLSRAFLWACPPQRGEGYIFHRHPANQRTPGKERLREWYDVMLAEAQAEGVVRSVSNLFDYFFTEDCQLKPSAGLLPVFAGDFVATEMERLVRDVCRRAVSKRNAMKAMQERRQASISRGMPPPTTDALPRSALSPGRIRTRGARAREQATEQGAVVMTRRAAAAAAVSGSGEAGSRRARGATGSSAGSGVGTAGAGGGSPLPQEPASSPSSASTGAHTDAHNLARYGVSLDGASLAEEVLQEVGMPELPAAQLQVGADIGVHEVQQQLDAMLRASVDHGDEHEDDDAGSVAESEMSVHGRGGGPQTKADVSAPGMRLSHAARRVPNLIEMLGERLLSMRKEFMVVHLATPAAAAGTTKRSRPARAAAVRGAVNAAEARDPQLSCAYFDTRTGFLRLCQSNNLQFDTLRRAKHSSMMVLYSLQQAMSVAPQ